MNSGTVINGPKIAIAFEAKAAILALNAAFLTFSNTLTKIDL